ncbi:MAG: hypothetical protein K0R05_2383 [Anaerocolumna sp.]|jgi:hypothetical protein|nr:hypothetical protein [Anaerocolumna sp.]
MLLENKEVNANKIPIKCYRKSILTRRSFRMSLKCCIMNLIEKKKKNRLRNKVHSIGYIS